MSYKKFGISVIFLLVLCIILLITLNVIIDPFFHYHKPLSFLHYYLNQGSQRYINDGIVKNFSYDAIITGTSMTENFKTSEFDELFDTNSIKAPLSGAYFKEVNDLLKNAFKSNNDIKYVVRSVEYSNFFRKKDEIRYEFDSYPNYLYNNNIFDDVNYLLNKDILYRSIHTLINKKSTTFDEYSYWSDKYTYGKDMVLETYVREEKRKIYELKESDIQTLKDSIKQNFISLIEDHPSTKFYFFYPPISIYSWDRRNQLGVLTKELIGEKIITEMLLEYDNVLIFSFLDMYDVITNLDNYKDYNHYSGKINSLILKSMKLGKHELTKDNYENYYDKIINFYTNYNYDALFN